MIVIDDISDGSDIEVINLDAMDVDLEADSITSPEMVPSTLRH